MTREAEAGQATVPRAAGSAACGCDGVSLVTSLDPDAARCRQETSEKLPLVLDPDEAKSDALIPTCSTSFGVERFSYIHPFGDGEVLEQATSLWWVLHTRSRNEKTVAAALARRRIQTYLPLVRRRRRYGRREVMTALPLFPGYLFLCGDLEARDVAWQTRRVAKVLPVENQELLKAELRQIQWVLESGEPVDLYPALREGSRCRIIGGAMRGLEGVVLRRRRISRLYIAVTMLGQSAVVEIDSALLEPVD